MEELIYPSEDTYFIAWSNDGSISYGINNRDQCTITGLDNLEKFTDKALYSSRLLDFNIVLGSE